MIQLDTKNSTEHLFKRNKKASILTAIPIDFDKNLGIHKILVPAIAAYSFQLWNSYNLENILFSQVISGAIISLLVLFSVNSSNTN